MLKQDQNVSVIRESKFRRVSVEVEGPGPALYSSHVGRGDVILFLSDVDTEVKFLANGRHGVSPFDEDSFFLEAKCPKSKVVKHGPARGGSVAVYRFEFAESLFESPHQLAVAERGSGQVSTCFSLDAFNRSHLSLRFQFVSMIKAKNTTNREVALDIAVNNHSDHRFRLSAKGKGHDYRDFSVDERSVVCFSSLEAERRRSRHNSWQSGGTEYVEIIIDPDEGWEIHA